MEWPFTKFVKLIYHAYHVRQANLRSYKFVLMESRQHTSPSRQPERPLSAVALEAQQLPDHRQAFELLGNQHVPTSDRWRYRLRDRVDSEYIKLFLNIPKLADAWEALSNEISPIKLQPNYVDCYGFQMPQWKASFFGPLASCDVDIIGFGKLIMSFKHNQEETPQVLWKIGEGLRQPSYPGAHARALVTHAILAGDRCLTKVIQCADATGAKTVCNVLNSFRSPTRPANDLSLSRISGALYPLELGNRYLELWLPE